MAINQMQLDCNSRRNRVAVELSRIFHKEDVRVKLAGEQLKIFPVNSDVHRAVTRYLTEKKLEFFVITPKNQRPLKAVLKGLPVSYSTAEIEEGLSELGLKLDQSTGLEEEDVTGNGLNITLLEVVVKQHGSSVASPDISSLMLKVCPFITSC
ncbi:hypothetical protein CEXT_671721 [Caerostris extrusa]|uniref:Uncharacterized protein n=1 Tax=Caerostris extrusa TaxID=172846 RepID=A0AAV4WPS1_CAEEX|nr:hypothetical protein CEXT_671721 [Caerostris extrusa]